MRVNGIAFVKWALSAAVAVAGLSVVATASADVSIGVDLGGPTYYQQPAPAYVVPEPAYVAPPPVYYQPAPPVYYERPAPPVYYAPPQGYYAPAPPVYGPAPGYGYGRGGYDAPAERPRLSDMQRRALDNCALLAPQERPRCRATVMSTTRY